MAVSMTVGNVRWVLHISITWERPLPVQSETRASRNKHLFNIVLQLFCSVGGCGLWGWEAFFFWLPFLLFMLSGQVRDLYLMSVCLDRSVNFYYQTLFCLLFSLCALPDVCFCYHLFLPCKLKNKLFPHSWGWWMQSKTERRELLRFPSGPNKSQCSQWTAWHSSRQGSQQRWSHRDDVGVVEEISSVRSKS